LIEMANKFFIGISSLAVLLQAVQSSGDVLSVASTAEHLTLTGVLLAGVVILWRSNVAKDAQILKMTEQVTSVAATATASNVELRKINEALVEQVQALKDAMGAKV
jgi:hypothetical protein